MTTVAQRMSGLALAVLLAAAAASPAGGRDHDDARALRDRGEIVPLEQILEAAARQRPGRVVEVELELELALERGGGTAYVYELEVLDAGGEVWELKYDARTGALIDQKKER
jgi:uncharacterized membrane protein YkoI